MSIWVLVGILLLLWIVFGHSKETGIRVIEEDYEARLAPLTPTGPAAGARAKVERERFRGGGEEFDLKCSGFDLPDGTPVEVVLNEETVGTFELKDGRGRFQLLSSEGVAVPEVQVSDVVELRCGGLPVLQGTFYRD